MGYGDELMLTGIVKKAYAKHQKPICLGQGGKNYLEEALWAEVFENNPKIAKKPYPGCVWVPDIKGNRPYLEYGKKTTYKDFRPEPGEIFFTEDEKKKYQGLGKFIYIEPNVKGSFGGNKDWGIENWEKLKIESTFIQGSGRKVLSYARQIETKTFRDACALLSKASLFVGTDSGMHHAAAALSIPAIVLWGGLVSPKILGYDNHTNLHSGTHSCGSWEPCSHCKEAMAWIKPEMVEDEIRKWLDL